MVGKVAQMGTIAKSVNTIITPGFWAALATIQIENIWDEFLKFSDLKKLDEWQVLIEPDFKSVEWIESDSSDSSDSDLDTDDDDDSDEMDTDWQLRRNGYRLSHNYPPKNSPC